MCNANKLHKTSWQLSGGGKRRENFDITAALTWLEHIEKREEGEKKQKKMTAFLFPNIQYGSCVMYFYDSEPPCQLRLQLRPRLRGPACGGSWVQRKRLSPLQRVFFKADPERVLKRFLLMASLQHSSNAPAFTVHIWFLLRRAISEGYKNAATKTHRHSMALVRGGRRRGKKGRFREAGLGGVAGLVLPRTQNCEETKPEAPPTSPVPLNIMNCINHKPAAALSVYVV